MKTVLSIFCRDLKRILKNPVALIVTIGVAIVPALYAWFNVAASWDPYGNTSNIKVAVVNSDTGASDDLVGTLNAGQLVITALHQNNDLGWVYKNADNNDLTEEEAVSGVERGEYYAAIVIPKDFSKNLLSITSGTYNKPDIVYYINEKRNTVVPEITNVGAETLQSQVSEIFISTVSGVVADKLESIVGNAEDITNSATSTIASKINETAATLSNSSDSLATLYTAIDESRSATANAKGSVSDLRGMLSDTQSTLSDATSQLSSTKDSSITLQNKVSGSLAGVNTTLGQVAGKAGTDIASYAGKIATAQGYVSGSLTVLKNANSNTTDVLNELAQAIANNPDLTDDQKAQLQNIYSELSSKNGELAVAIAELQAISDTIQSNADAMSGSSEEISSDIEQRITRLSSNALNLTDSVFPVLNESLDALSSASGNLGGVLSSLDPVLVQATSILDELDSTLDSASGSVSLIQSSLSDVSGTLNRVATDISTISLSQLTDDFDSVVGADAQSVASFMVSPVEINTEVMYEVEKYGSAAAPFYTNLAIWVGGFVLIAIYKQEVDSDGLEDQTIRPHTAYLGRLLLYLLIGQLQAIIVCIGDVLMGIQCTSPVAFVFAGMVQSFVYVNIIFALAVAFKHIGKALAVVIVILQIPGTSGLYPIEMMPDFFRNLEPWLPFTYGIRAMRESIAGFYGNHYAVALLQLLAFVIPALLLGMAARRRLVNINALFDKRLAATELMVCEQASLESNNYGLRSMVRMIRETSYAESAQLKAAEFEKRYAKLSQWGVACLVLIPIGLLLLLFAIDSKDVVLNIWVLSCIILCSALIVIEYVHDNLNRKSEIAQMTDDEVHALLDSKIKGGE